MPASIENFGQHDKAGDITAALRRDGVAIVRELLPADEMDSLVALLDPDLDRQQPGGGEFFGHRARSTGRLFAHDPAFSEHLLLNPLTLEVADAFLRPQVPAAPGAKPSGSSYRVGATGFGADDIRRGYDPDPDQTPYCHHYRVNAAGSIQICGGGPDQVLHREMDNYWPYMKHDPARHECILQLAWAGSDYTAENGATRIAPGSHLWELERKAEPHEVAQAVMPKGSLVFWTGKVFHGAGGNRTDGNRTGIIYSLVVDWLATEENQYLAVPPEIARMLPERAQQLIGYRASSRIGWVTGRDGQNLLQDRRT